MFHGIMEDGEYSKSKEPHAQTHIGADRSVGRDRIFGSHISIFRALSSGQTRMGLASGGGSVALLTSFEGKKPHLKE